MAQKITERSYSRKGDDELMKLRSLSLGRSWNCQCTPVDPTRRGLSDDFIRHATQQGRNGEVSWRTMNYYRQYSSSGTSVTGAPDGKIDFVVGLARMHGVVLCLLQQQFPFDVFTFLMLFRKTMMFIPACARHCRLSDHKRKQKDESPLIALIKSKVYAPFYLVNRVPLVCREVEVTDSPISSRELERKKIPASTEGALVDGTWVAQKADWNRQIIAGAIPLFGTEDIDLALPHNFSSTGEDHLDICAFKQIMEVLRLCCTTFQLDLLYAILHRLSGRGALDTTITSVLIGEFSPISSECDNFDELDWEEFSKWEDTVLFGDGTYNYASGYTSVTDYAFIARSDGLWQKPFWFDIILILLTLGRANPQGPPGMTNRPLAVALYEERADIAALLLDHGAAIEDAGFTRLRTPQDPNPSLVPPVRMLIQRLSAKLTSDSSQSAVVASRKTFSCLEVIFSATKLSVTHQDLPRVLGCEFVGDLYEQCLNCQKIKRLKSKQRNSSKLQEHQDDEEDLEIAEVFFSILQICIRSILGPDEQRLFNGILDPRQPTDPVVSVDSPPLTSKKDENLARFINAPLTVARWSERGKRAPSTKTTGHQIKAPVNKPAAATTLSPPRPGESCNAMDLVMISKKKFPQTATMFASVLKGLGATGMRPTQAPFFVCLEDD